jgi:hypothetical protein
LAPLSPFYLSAEIKSNIPFERSSFIYGLVWSVSVNDVVSMEGVESKNILVSSENNSF